MSVIVTGAAGHLGRLVADHLLQRIPPGEVVLATRSPQALRDYAAQGVDVRHCDFDDRASLPDAFAGGRRMLLISSDALGRRVHQHRVAIAAAARAGVEQVVFTSHVNPVGNPVGFFAQDLGETEVILQQSGLVWTVLRFGSFAELQLAAAATAVQNGRLITNGGEGRIVPVSRRDCAEAAAVTLTSDGHEGLTYDISGPQAFTPSELAVLYGEVSARPLDVVHMSDWLLTVTLMGIGTPWPSARSVVAFGRAVREGWFDVVDPAVERLTGHPPVALRDVLVRQHANLLAVG